MKVKLIILIIFVNIIYPSISHTNAFNDYLCSFLKEIEKRKAAVFYSTLVVDESCNSEAILIFELGNLYGLLIELRRNNVINLTTVEITKDGYRIGDTHGGIYTRTEVQMLINKITSGKFSLLYPFKTAELKKPLQTFEWVPPTCCGHDVLE